MVMVMAGDEGGGRFRETPLPPPPVEGVGRCGGVVSVGESATLKVTVMVSSVAVSVAPQASFLLVGQ